MRCPKCTHEPYRSDQPCPNCQFSGPPDLIETLAHVRWLQAEIRTWGESLRWHAIAEQYAARARDIEIALRLRPPPFAPAEARDAWHDVIKRETLGQWIAHWQRAALLNLAVTFTYLEQAGLGLEATNTTLQRLAGYDRPTYPRTDADQLGILNFLVEAVAGLERAGCFMSPEAAQQARSPLTAAIEKTEIKLGLRPRPQPQPRPRRQPVKPPANPAESPATPAPEAKPRRPLRERLWQSLVSERALQAMLFLGVFLLLAAAISFVVWGWSSFSPLLRIVFPAGFTALFFVLGWYVRSRIRLYRSGIALSGIAALLIPIDFYTVFANLAFRPEDGPWFWLAVSLICLAAYLAITVVIQNAFFAYLVGVAAGGVSVALVDIGHQMFGLPLDWRFGAVSVTCLLLAGVAFALRRVTPPEPDAGSASHATSAPNSTSPRSPAQRLAVLGPSLRSLSLLSLGVLMPLTFGLRYITRAQMDPLHDAMSLTWLIGSALFGWGAVVYRSRSLGLLACLTLPVSLYLSLDGFFARAGIEAVWHALGWALLTPLYFVAARRLEVNSPGDVLRSLSRMAGVTGVLLVVMAAVWSVADLTGGLAPAATHAVLAGSVVVAIRLWRRPRLVYLSVGLALSAVSFAASEIGLSLSQLGIGAASLSIALLLITLRLDARKLAAFAQPTFISAYTVAALAVLPAFVFYDGHALAYVLGNWIALAAWGARLAHIGQPSFTQAKPATQPSWPTLVRWLGFTATEWLSAGLTHLRAARFHWFTAAPLPIWLWLLFANRGPLDASLPLSLTALSLAMLALSYRLGNAFSTSLKAPSGLPSPRLAPHEPPDLAIRREREERREEDALDASLHRNSSAGRTNLDGFATWPWRLMALLTSAVAVISAFAIAPDSLAPAVSLIAAGVLYSYDSLRAQLRKERWAWLLVTPGLLAFAWGMGRLLDQLGRSPDVTNLVLAALASAYVLLGIAIGQVSNLPHHSPADAAAHPAPFSREFLLATRGAAYLLTVAVLMRIYVQATPVSRMDIGLPPTDFGLICAAVCHLLLCIAYALYAWSTYREAWAHVAAWFFVGAGGLIAIGFSTGQGSSAAKAALLAGVLVLAERGLHALARNRRSAPAIPRLRLSPSRAAALARLIWRLSQRPLLFAGWSVAAGAIGLALVRNLVLLGGGTVQQTWAAAGLLLITGLLALSARLFRQTRFVWLAAGLSFAPWTILTHLNWFTPYHFSTPGFAASWAVLAWVLLIAGWTVARAGAIRYALPLRVAAHGLIVFALAWGVSDTETSRVTFALAIGLYAACAAVDLRTHRAAATTTSHVFGATRFLYPAIGLAPAWFAYLLSGLFPDAVRASYGALLLACSGAALAVGLFLQQRLAPEREPARAMWGLPGYLTALVCVPIGWLLVMHDTGALAIALLYGGALMLISARLFNAPAWAYAASLTLPASLTLFLHLAGVRGDGQGLGLIALGAVYAVAAVLGRGEASPSSLARYRSGGDASPLLVIGFVVMAAGLALCSQERWTAFWGFSVAATVFAGLAVILRQPSLLSPACVLAAVPYGIALIESSIPRQHYGLALMPGAIAALLIGVALDRRVRGSAPQDTAGATGVALWVRRWLSSWSLPLHVLGLGLTLASPAFTAGSTELALNFALQTCIFGWAVIRFRQREWLTLAALAGQLAYGYALIAPDPFTAATQVWVRFLPAVAVTLAGAMLIEFRHRRSTGASSLLGWARPLYALVAIDLLAGSVVALLNSNVDAGIFLWHAILLAVWATFAASSRLAYASAGLGVIALLQSWWAFDAPAQDLPVRLALLALGYGLAGYALTYLRQHKPRAGALPARWLEVVTSDSFAAWVRPLTRGAFVLSMLSLLLAAILGEDIAGWTARALLGFPFREIVDLSSVQMAVGVLALLGLLYVAAAFTYRHLRLGYVSVGMLLAAWSLHAFYVQQWDSAGHLQWYAVPAGVFLLGIGGLEWQRGNKTLARWLDYAAMPLMLGSLFWQTLMYGWRFALLLGIEGCAAFWWGSARRLRRFLYAGVVAIILATVAQLLNSLQSVNQWIVFGIIGLLLVVAGLILERRLRQIKAWQDSLGTWE